MLDHSLQIKSDLTQWGLEAIGQLPELASSLRGQAAPIDTDAGLIEAPPQQGPRSLISDRDIVIGCRVLISSTDITPRCKAIERSRSCPGALLGFLRAGYPLASALVV